MPVGWTRGESIMLSSYADKIVWVRYKASPFDAAHVAKTKEFSTPQESNAWMLWWFGETQ